MASDAQSDKNVNASGQNDVEVEKQLDRHNEHEEEEYPPRKVVIPAILAGYLVVFLVALDRTILGTAVPSISNEFQSFTDIAWYEAGYFLPLCVFGLSFGKLLTFYSTKWVIVILTAVFEIGNIICAAAPSSNALIVGRVVSGIGSAGITAGVLVLINELVPLSKRPKYAGGIGAVFGLSSILGPLLGGYLTAITWRWVFWINLPIGGVALLILIVVTPSRKPPAAAATTWQGKIKQLDPLGFVLLAPAVICILFALQWGGIVYPWGSGRIIALLVLTGVFGSAFVASQIWGPGGLIPRDVISQRSVIAAIVQAMGGGSLLIVYSFYLPIWFQAIKGDSPQNSGLALLALLLSTVVFVIGTGIGISAVGWYTPFAIIGGILVVIGTALVSTFQVNTPMGVWIGYQIILGAGQGTTLQQPNIAVQTVLSKEKAPQGLAILQFAQSLAGTIFITVCQTLLQNKLVINLAPLGIDAAAISGAGATSLRSLVTAEQLPAVLEAYNLALRDIWYTGIALSVVGLLAAFGYEWKSVKKEEEKAKQVKLGEEKPETLSEVDENK